MQVTASPKTFCEGVVAAASIRPNSLAMTLIEPEGEQTMTFGSMLARIRSIAYRLTQEKIAFGDRVALIGENHPNWAIAYLGILYRGAVVTPMDPAATTQSLAAFLKGSQAKLAFVSPPSVEKFRAACEQIGNNIPAVALRPLAEPDGLGRFEDWSATPAPEEFLDASPVAKPEDLAVLIYTSG
ncbi:MAG: class I adenylate-forming enzyme family protein, partial [Pyrinomonadaceae bacterium]